MNDRKKSYSVLLNWLKFMLPDFEVSLKDLPIRIKAFKIKTFKNDDIHKG